MLKSIVQILFNSEYEVEIEKKYKRGVEGEREGGREIVTTHGPSGLQLVLHLGLLGGVGS